MKSKINILLLTLIIFFIKLDFSFSNENFNFDVTEIEIKDKGNRFLGKNGGKALPPFFPRNLLPLSLISISVTSKLKFSLENEKSNLIKKIIKVSNKMFILLFINF